jgi:hypothetical protein
MFPNQSFQPNNPVIPGVLGQSFTSSGTFTIPTGVTALKITVVGAGGGGGGGANGVGPSGSGGGGGTAIKYLTGVTPGNTLSVAIGALGAGGGSFTSGGAGGNSTVSSGTQIITSIVGNGGGGGVTGISGAPGAGGSFSGQTIGVVGGSPPYGTINTSSIQCNTYYYSLTSAGGNSLMGSGGTALSNFSTGITWAGTNAYGYGGGGSGSGGSTYSGGSGTQGIVIFEW